MLDSFEPFFPLSDLLLYSLPFSELDLTKHMALDDNFFTKLIDFCVNDLVLNCIDCPKFYLFHIDLYVPEAKHRIKFMINEKYNWQLTI